MNTETRQLHAIITGRVQGVSFRYYTQETAVHLGVTGWVRNLADGAVEVVAEGPPDKLDALLKFLRRGPRAAHVTSVNVEWRAPGGNFEDFHVR